MENFKFPGLSRTCRTAGVQFYVAQASQGIIYFSDARYILHLGDEGSCYLGKAGLLAAMLGRPAGVAPRRGMEFRCGAARVLTAVTSV